MQNVEFVGRSDEIAFLKKKLESNESEFIAIYGRRRIGKTSLVRHIIELKQPHFIEITGLKDGRLSEQLDIFSRAFVKAFSLPYEIAQPKNWMRAFEMLTHAIKQLPSGQKMVIFLDELPWLASPKSGLLQALDHFWNTEWVHLSYLKLIICGSAASWILDNVINAKGGLHNRLTASILLKPFHIYEVAQFLKSRAIKMQPLQILHLYLVMGGVPFYLKALEKGKSVSQIVDNLCFTSNGLLYNEFERLFSSLFNQSEIYIQIIRAIAKKPNGIDQNKLRSFLKQSAGGTLTKRLNELEAAGFIISFIPYGKEKKGIYYRVIDEYTLFYLKWIEPISNRIKLAASQSNYWQSKEQTGPWLNWIGNAFEIFCYKHIDQIIKAMKIHTGFEIGTWYYQPKSKNEKGVQIDLLLDRDDGVVNIIEIKFSQKLYRITKEYASELGDKLDIFSEQLKTSKDLHLTMITTNGLLPNIYSKELVENEITLNDFFEAMT